MVDTIAWDHPSPTNSVTYR